MILNVTKEPREAFVDMKRIALRGQTLQCSPFSTIEEFAEIFEKCKNVTAVIVDENDPVLANDIINYVSRPVLTSRVEVEECITKTKFVEYE